LWAGKGSELSEENKDELEELIKKMLSSGQIDPEAISKLSGLKDNPALMASLFAQARFLMEPGDAVNWEAARTQALAAAKSAQRSSTEAFEEEIKRAFEIAALWLQESTDFQNSNPPKLFTREMWVQDALPLFSKLGDPVAKNMSKALGENLAGLLPEEMQAVAKPAAHFIQNAGAAIFATQLGVVLGQLSTKTISAGEIGIPIVERPGIISQNLEELLSDLETPKSEVLIYIALRELAISSLYQSNRWLADQLTTQVIEFAAGLKIELSGLQEIVQDLDPSDPDAVNKVMEASGSFAKRSPEQEIALERIELLLALIEGYADAVAGEAGKRLPNISSAIELMNRRRATAGAAEKTFQILLGLEIKPKPRRDAKAMWESLTKEQRDNLWLHPDQMPSAQEIANPKQLIERISRSGDDFDGELRKLLGD
jgi:putative hydrolase